MVKKRFNSLDIIIILINIWKNFQLNIIKNENLELTEKFNALERENALLKDTIKKHEAQLNDLRKTSLTKDQTTTLLQEQVRIYSIF